MSGEDGCYSSPSELFILSDKAPVQKWLQYRSRQTDAHLLVSSCISRVWDQDVSLRSPSRIRAPQSKSVTNTCSKDNLPSISRGHFVTNHRRRAKQEEIGGRLFLLCQSRLLFLSACLYVSSYYKHLVRSNRNNQTRKWEKETVYERPMQAAYVPNHQRRNRRSGYRSLPTLVRIPLPLPLRKRRISPLPPGSASVGTRPKRPKSNKNKFPATCHSAPQNHSAVVM